MKKETNKSNQEKGITLIALVLTIIVLMILAAVSVATLTGDNGILTKAQEAKETAKKAEIEEQLRLAELSAKIKREGRAITVSDLLQELESQGVDFETGEGGNSIIIDGKYVIEIQEKDGELKFEDQGTVSKPKPKVVSIEIVDETPTTIKVKVSTLRNEGGTLKYYIKEEGAKDYGPGEEQKETEYTFKNLDPNKTYTRIKVEAKAPNGETGYLETEISNIPSLAEAEEGAVAVELSYHANGQTIGAEDWTKGPLTVTVSAETQGYVLQTSKDGTNWKTGETGSYTIEENTKIASQETKQITSRATTRSTKQTSSQIFEENGTLYARLFDTKTNKGGKPRIEKISNIDTLPPRDFTPVVNEDDIKSNSITVTGMTEDAMEANETEANETEGSGIATYYFSIDEGNGKPENWEPTWIPEGGQMAVKGTNASYQFEGLKKETTYRIKMKAIDKVGRETVSEEITATTGTVPGGKDNIGMGGLTESAEIGIDYELADWTSGDVNVTLTNNSGNTNCYLQYQKCKVDMTDYSEDRWENYEEGTPITFTKNGVILARLTDNKIPGQTGNVGVTATGNVKKIDKLPPVAFDETTLTAISTHNSITVTARAEDQAATTEYGCSGIDEEEGYRFKLGEGDWTAWQSSGEYTFDSNLSADTNYTITVETKDNAGKTTTGTVTIKTEKETVLNYKDSTCEVVTESAASSSSFGARSEDGFILKVPKDSIIRICYSGGSRTGNFIASRTGYLNGTEINSYTETPEQGPPIWTFRISERGYL